jgi:predicted acyl esterase
MDAPPADGVRARVGHPHGTTTTRPATGCRDAALENTTARVTSIVVDLDVPSRMRDGVILTADVYRAAGGGPWPMLVARTTCGKGVPSETAWNGVSPTEAGRRGFMTVVKDRGGQPDPCLA